MIWKRCNYKTWITTTRSYGPGLKAGLHRFYFGQKAFFLHSLQAQANFLETHKQTKFFAWKKCDVNRLLVVKIYFFSLSVFLSYRLRSHCFNNLNFLKTLPCIEALCFFVTIHQRHHSLFVCYCNFVVFSKSNVI